jgi:hypothetical protein
MRKLPSVDTKKTGSGYGSHVFTSLINDHIVNAAIGTEKFLLYWPGILIAALLNSECKKNC